MWLTWMVAGGVKDSGGVPASTLSLWKVHSTTPSPKLAKVETESWASTIA